METGMVETILGLVFASWEKVEEQDHHLRDGGNYFNKQGKKKKKTNQKWSQKGSFCSI